jgi:hypothetical protein
MKCGEKKREDKNENMEETNESKQEERKISGTRMKHNERKWKIKGEKKG